MEVSPRNKAVSGIGEEISVSRNTLKAILTEATGLDIAEVKHGKTVVITDEFFQNYSDCYLSEWKQIDGPASKNLAKTFRGIVKKFIPMDFEKACRQTLELSILSRSGSVNSSRGDRLSEKSADGKVDLSSWIVWNTFNRDLLLLLMSAAR